MQPFRIELTAGAVDDLRARLRRTRWPGPATTPGWAQGTPLAYARDLCTYWSDGYDWAAAEQRLNRHPQFRTTIDGLGIHFLHVRSPHPDAVPLLMTHGWPGSIVEFAEVVTALADSFHVVCPSLPGYGFSDPPRVPGWTVHRTADAWAELMGRLGYDRFLAQGHDWGTSVSTALAKRHPGRVLGLHLMPPLVAADPATLDDLTPAERSALDDLAAAESGDGYSAVQSTRPQTPLAPLGRAPLPRHPLLERTRAGRPLRRLRATRTLRRGGAGLRCGPARPLIQDSSAARRARARRLPSCMACTRATGMV